MMRKTKTTKANSQTSGRRAFGVAFVLTLCVLLLGSGCLVADYNTRRIGQGEGRLYTDAVVEDGRLMLSLWGRETDIRWSSDAEAWVGRLWAVLPPRWRAEWWLWETERQWTPRLWQAIGVG